MCENNCARAADLLSPISCREGRIKAAFNQWYLLSSSTCTPMEWNSLWLRLSVSESDMVSTCSGDQRESLSGKDLCEASGTLDLCV